MTYSTITAKDGREIKRLGIQPEFEGVVIPRYVSAGNGLEAKVRQAFLFDATEAAFAWFNHWPLDERQKWLQETIRYFTDNMGNEKRIKLPVLEGWVIQHFVEYRTGRERSIDQIAEEIWKLWEAGVRKEHEKMDKFLVGNAISDDFEEPCLTKGGIWHARVKRRGDERGTERGREIRLANAEIRNGKFNIAGLEIVDPSPLFRENIGRERRHGDDPEILHIVGYHPMSLIYWINGLSPEKKIEKGLSPNYRVLMPYDFNGHEFLVIEAVGRRYLPIKTALKSQVSNLFPVSAYINDHPETFAPEIRQAIEERLAFVGIGKYKFEDKPHRKMLGSIEKLLESLGYRFNGFALNFRRYGEQYQTASVVFSNEDASRNVHIIYDSKFNAPPLLLEKFTPAEWGKENRDGRYGWTVKKRMDTSPFEMYNQWRPDFDRHTQSQLWLPSRIIQPHEVVLAQHPEFRKDYERFEQSLKR